MQNLKACATRISIFAGLFASLLVGACHADDTVSCKANCAADLKECRKQASIATNQEAIPMLTDSSARRAYKGQEGAFDKSSGLANSKNDEIQKRVDERYRECSTGNSNCLAGCTSGSAKPKISVILK